MELNNYKYKGFDVTCTDKCKKMREEYFNPYGYNLYSTTREVIDTNYNMTHTNQNSRKK